MRARPQPNPRRGLLRAGVVVIVLTALLLLAIFIVSTATAPQAKAPTVPATPILITPRPTLPVGTPRATPRATPQATKKATTKPLHDIGLAPPSYADAAARPSHAAASQFVPRFSGEGDAYRGKTLSLVSAPAGQNIRVGRADPFVRPVLAGNGRTLLFVRVAPVRAYPGARWSLWAFDTATRHSHVLTQVTAMGLAPLGWLAGSPLYMVTNATDTTVYALHGVRGREVSILAPQPVDGAILSPDGSSIAFVTPSDCTYCTLALFDLARRTTWNGPTGFTTVSALAWSSDGLYLIGSTGGRMIAVNARDHSQRTFAQPRRLPANSLGRMEVWVRGNGLTLRDAVTGQTYSAPAVTSIE